MTVTITTSHLYRPVLFAQHIIIYAVKRKIIGMGGSCGQEEGSHSQPAGQKSQFHKIRLSLVFRILLSKSKSPGMDNKKRGLVTSSTLIEVSPKTVAVIYE